MPPAGVPGRAEGQRRQGALSASRLPRMLCLLCLLCAALCTLCARWRQLPATLACPRCTHLPVCLQHPGALGAPPAKVAPAPVPLPHGADPHIVPAGEGVGWRRLSAHRPVRVPANMLVLRFLKSR